MGNKSSRYEERQAKKKGTTKRSLTDSYNVRVRASGIARGVPHGTTDCTSVEEQSEEVLTQGVNKEGSEAIEEPHEEGRMDRHPTRTNSGENSTRFEESATDNGHVRSDDGNDIPVTLQEQPPLPRLVQTVVDLRVALHSQATEEVKIHTLQSVPPNVQALKEHIQSNYNVPISGQTVLFDSVPLEDHETLPLHYMRTGDTIDVYFLCEVDILFISSVLNTLSHTATYLDSVVPYLCQATGIQMELSMQQIQEIRILVEDYFWTSSTELSRANFLFFCESGGAELVFQVHRHLLTHPWEGLCSELKLMEGACLYLCQIFTELCTMYNKPAIQHSLVHIIIRIASEARAKWCPICKSLAVSQEASIKETKYQALQALTNLIEALPDCRAHIASHESLTAHLVNPISIRVITKATPLDYKILRVALYGIMSLAFSTEAHQYLVKPHIIDCVMSAPTKQSGENYKYSRYVANIFLAMIAANSSTRHVISNAQLRSISAYMREFLNSVNLNEVNKYEEQSGIYWMTMQPHVGVAYTPLPPATNRVSPQEDQQTEQQDEYELVLRSIEVAIVSLHVMNLNPVNKDVLMKEGLLDFVQCLPWQMPPESRAMHRALQLVMNLKATLINPPTLQNIARAKLAATHFGLDAVLHKHIHELCAELYS